MAFYEFICDDCGKTFDVQCKISERNQPRPCPYCKGEKTRRTISNVAALPKAGAACSTGGSGSPFT